MNVDKENLMIILLAGGLGKRLDKKTSKQLIRRLITREDPRSPVSEAYRGLRTSMLFTNPDKNRAKPIIN